MLFFILSIVLVIDISMVSWAGKVKQAQNSHLHELGAITDKLGITDLCLSTEARYTRHPAVSDPMASFMDHPGAIEHFPSGSFFQPSKYPGSSAL